ncbi:MAG: hypothetical protein J2P15_06270 [Micromonosporaceae bacterium]|nr:hypothetical protein [Micromonosporaceae bacterium]
MVPDPCTAVALDPLLGTVYGQVHSVNLSYLNDAGPKGARTTCELYMGAPVGEDPPPEVFGSLINVITDVWTKQAYAGPDFTQRRADEGKGRLETAETPPGFGSHAYATLLDAPADKFLPEYVREYVLIVQDRNLVIRFDVRVKQDGDHPFQYSVAQFKVWSRQALSQTLARMRAAA